MNLIELYLLRQIHEKIPKNSLHKKVFFALMKERNMTINELSEAVGFNGQKIKNVIQELKKKKIIEEDGALLNLKRTWLI